MRYKNIKQSLEFFAIILCFNIINMQAQETILPNNLTEDEKAVYRDYAPPQIDAVREQPPGNVRTMAEWEKLRGIQITWTSYLVILRQIVDYAQDEGLVYIVCSDSNSVKNYLTRYGIPLVNLRFLIEPYNSIWCRDYGPWTAYAEDTDELFILDWIYNRPRPSDDVIPFAFAGFIGAPYFGTTEYPDDLVHTGGNFMTDGQGNAFSSKLILDENSGKTEAQIDDIMERYMGINRFIKMTKLPYDEIHHIDMHIKLLDEETLLVGQYPSGVADGPQIESNLQYILNNYLTCYGRPYKVIRIPMPPDQSGRYPDNGGDYRTYTNSLICNKTVIVPTYEQKYDSTALRIYREAMPGYRVVGINCNEIITSLGAIHCITKEVGEDDPVLIAHAAIREAYSSQNEYPVLARITSGSGIETADLFWTADTTAGFTQISMSPAGTDSFYAAIPKQTGGTDVYYYISATTEEGKTITRPLTAPQGWHRFLVEEPSDIYIADNLMHPSIQLEQNFPNPFNPETRIRFTVRGDGAKAVFVHLSIYNMLGQKITDLVNQTVDQGSQEVRFNAESLPAGIYICRFYANGITQSRKMIFLK